MLELALEKTFEDFKAMKWGPFLEIYDKYSFKDFLLNVANFSRGAVDFLQVMLNHEAYMMPSMVETVMDECLRSDKRLDRIVGGMDNLARSFLPILGSYIRLQSKVNKISQDYHGVSVQ